MSTDLHSCVVTIMNVVLTVHIQLVQFGMDSACLGSVREKAEAHSIEKPGVIEIEACLEVR